MTWRNQKNPPNLDWSKCSVGHQRSEIHWTKAREAQKRSKTSESLWQLNSVSCSVYLARIVTNCEHVVVKYTNNTTVKHGELQVITNSLTQNIQQNVEDLYKCPSVDRSESSIYIEISSDHIFWRASYANYALFSKVEWTFTFPKTIFSKSW